MSAHHIDLKKRLLRPGHEFTIEEAREIVNDLYEHYCIDTEDRFHNRFFHEICPLLLIAEHAADSMTRVVFTVEDTRFDGAIILGDERRTQKVEMTAAIDGHQDALRMELLDAPGHAPAFQKIRASDTEKNRIFDDDDDENEDEVIIPQQYYRGTLLPLIEKALERKVKKAQANVSYNGSWLGIVFDDWIMPINHIKKRRFDPVCEQILAGKSGQYHPFSRVFFIGISRKYIFDSWDRRLSSGDGSRNDR